MTRQEEAVLAETWLRWLAQSAVEEPVDNGTYVDFIAEVLRRDRRFCAVHVFEVLDVLVNAESHIRKRA